MKKRKQTIAFALGGLAGNNAHGAGFLQAAIDMNIRPELVSCTSGQIYWVYKYLKERDSKKNLRNILCNDIEKTTPFKNTALDMLTLSIFGKGDVFRPAYNEYISDFAENFRRLALKAAVSPASINPLTDTASMIPARMLAPQFPADFFNNISTTFDNSDTGIIFNSYDPVTGIESVYINDAAQKKLGVQYGETNTYRVETRYEKITPETVKSGLWIYQYGFEPDTKAVDGAYYRQILLSELVHADLIFVARPINHKWIGCLPANQTALEDLKTEIAFNGSYAGERDKIMLVNKLLVQGRLSHDNYRHIELTEIEIQTQEGYFDYIFEKAAVFDSARAESAKVMKSKTEYINNKY